MLITQEMVGIALIGIIIGIVGTYITLSVKTESRLTSLENKVQLIEPVEQESRITTLEQKVQFLEPVAKILQDLGSDHVDKKFREKKK